MDLKVQSTHCDKQRPVRMFTKFLRLKKGEIKTIFEFLIALIRDHIRMVEYELQTGKRMWNMLWYHLLFEIIMNSIYWSVRSKFLEKLNIIDYIYIFVDCCNLWYFVVSQVFISVDFDGVRNTLVGLALIPWDVNEWNIEDWRRKWVRIDPWTEIVSIALLHS